MKNSDRRIKNKEAKSIESSTREIMALEGVRISNQEDNHSKHDYLRDTLVSTYRECISCKIRTQFTCLKCGYCYSCHWKKEELEKVESESLVTSNSVFSEKYPPATIIIEQSSSQQQQTKAIDVYGQQIEPICNFRTCSHRFSVHGNSSHMCKCLHPLNYATGVSLWPLTKEEKEVL